MTWMEMKKKISHLIELSRNLEKALNIREAAARLVLSPFSLPNSVVC